MAEQLGVGHFHGNGATVHGNERLALARALLMDRLGKQLLARPGFTQHQHRNVESCDALCPLLLAFQRLTFTNDSSVTGEAVDAGTRLLHEIDQKRAGQLNGKVDRRQALA
ncbi:hypothetical protein D3C76_1656620 [compost metagenome]